MSLIILDESACANILKKDGGIITCPHYKSNDIKNVEDTHKSRVSTRTFRINAQSKLVPKK